MLTLCKNNSERRCWRMLLILSPRYDLKQMLMKSSISRVPEELRKHEAAQQKSQKGSGQKKIEDSSGFAGKGGWQ